MLTCEKHIFSLLFRDSFKNDATAIKAFINTAIAETNQGYANSKVPIVMNLQCIIETAVQDNPNSEVMLNAFKAAASESNAYFKKKYLLKS